MKIFVYVLRHPNGVLGNRYDTTARGVWADRIPGWGRYSQFNQQRLIEQWRGNGYSVVPVTVTEGHFDE